MLYFAYGSNLNHKQMAFRCRDSKYIRKFNRFGIPFNAVYGPSIVSGKVLPELLTIGTVINSLQESSKKNRTKKHGDKQFILYTN